MEFKYLSYAMDPKLHQRMKEHCTKHRITIRQFLTALIVDALRKAKNATNNNTRQ
jgi:hypothetical protein